MNAVSQWTFAASLPGPDPTREWARTEVVDVTVRASMTEALEAARAWCRARGPEAGYRILGWDAEHNLKVRGDLVMPFSG